MQAEFKLCWTQHHLHSSSLSCLCEDCLGKLPSESCSHQDSIAYGLNEYLSKILRNNPFGIGLDPQIFHHNSLELEHRLQLTKYALADCLSMQRLIIHMRTQYYNVPFSILSTTPSSPEILELSSTSPIHTVLHSPHSSSSHLNSSTIDLMLARPCALDPIHCSSTHRSSNRTDTNRLRHNRRCTLRQRARLYTFSVIKCNIDLHFHTREIKYILSTLDIPNSAVNAPVSQVTGKRSLYSGFTENTHLSEYERRLRYLFTSAHYNQFRRRFLS